MAKVLLTGGAGFIGSHVALVLLEKGHEVFILDSLVNSSYKVIERINKILGINNKSYKSKLTFIKGDILKKNIIEDIFHKECDSKKPFEAVIHLAGLKSVYESINNPINYWKVNVKGTINLLATMQKYGCFNLIFSSSAVIYGLSDNSLIKENNVIKPINPYGQTKEAVERFFIDIFNSKKDSWSIISLRFFNPIGAHKSGLIGECPLEKPNNIFPTLYSVASGKMNQLKIFGKDWETSDGTCIRDYIHVMDIAEGHVMALEKQLSEKNNISFINLGTAKGTSVLELVKAFQSENKIDIPYIFSERREGDRCRVVADNSLALEILGWKPKRNIREMCKDGWNWYCLNPNGY